MILRPWGYDISVNSLVVSFSSVEGNLLNVCLSPSLALGLKSCESLGTHELTRNIKSVRPKTIGSRVPSRNECLKQKINSTVSFIEICVLIKQALDFKERGRDRAPTALLNIDPGALMTTLLTVENSS